LVLVLSSWSQCEELDCGVVVVAVVAAPDDLELELPPLAAIATPVPPRASTVAVASKAACLGRNTFDLLSVVCSSMEVFALKSSRRWI
jgi:hypothetical protein